MKKVTMKKQIIIYFFLFGGIIQVLYAQDNGIVPENPKISKKELKGQAIKYERLGEIDSAIIAYEKLLSIDTTLNILNYEIGRLWNKLGNQRTDTAIFNNSIRYFEAYLSNFKIKSEEYPKGERDSTGYHKTYQNVFSIKKKVLSLNQQIRDIYKYDSLLKVYEGYWVSYFFSKSRMVPQWIFHFERDSINGTLSVELHKASFRFSSESPNQKDFPIILEDGSLAFRMSKQKTFTPSQNSYYLKHLFVDLSNPTHPLMVDAARGKKPDERFIPENFIEQQKEKDAQLHAQLDEQLREEIKRARIEKTDEEFFITPISDTVINVACREIIANPIARIGGVLIDTLECVFYKIPEDMTFIILGRRNIRFQNKEHSKEDLKEIGFTKWNNLSITGNVFGHIGYLTIVGGLTMGYGTFWEFYRLGILMMGTYIDNIGNEELMRNPKKWNTKMYNMLLNHYNPDETLNLKSTAKEITKETKKEKKKREKEEKKKLDSENENNNTIDTKYE